MVGTTAALVMGGLAAAGAVGGAAINSHAAGKASDIQSKTADQIAAEAPAVGAKSIAAVKDATGDANTTLSDAKAEQLKALAPYIQAGTVSLQDLQDLLSDKGSLATDKFSFGAKDFGANDPGFAFIRDQANKQAQRVAASQGTLFSGSTQAAMGRLNSGLASTHLDEAFNRALQTYNTNRQNTLMRIQGLQNITGLGYNATAQQDQDIGSTATQIARNKMFAGQYEGDTGLHTFDTVAGAQVGKANAQSAGVIGSGNAWAQGLGGVANTGLNAALLYKMPQFQMPTPMVMNPAQPFGSDALGAAPAPTQAAPYVDPFGGYGTPGLQYIPYRTGTTLQP